MGTIFLRLVLGFTFMLIAVIAYGITEAIGDTVAFLVSPTDLGGLEYIAFPLLLVIMYLIGYAIELYLDRKLVTNKDADGPNYDEDEEDEYDH